MASDGGAQAATKGRWNLTADTFERLLGALDPDRERAGVDTRIGDSVTLGVSGGEANPDVQLNNADDKTTARMMQFGVYGRMKKHRSYFDGGINFGTRLNA